MTRRRVVVTGLGVVSSIGVGAREYAAGLRAGRSGAAPISVFDTTGFAHHVGCEVTGFDAARWVTEQPVEHLGRAARFSVAAARMAVADAGLSGLDTAMVCVGTTDGGGDAGERLAEHAVRGTAPVATLVRQVPAATIPLAVARELRLSDVDIATMATACAAGNYALGNGFDAVASGEVDVALCGGADAMCRMTFTGFYRLGAIDPHGACRPFDVDRAGILTGEGAGVLVLESLAHAEARGARIYAEVLGYGLNCDATHPVAPDRDSVAGCMRLALADAGVRPDQVDLISAHGTGTRANDATECGAIHDVFGTAPPRTVSVKSMLGHTMGAASALSAIACVLAITEGFVPPTINHVETDPECGIDCVPNVSVPADLRVVQNNALAFGGNNAVVLFGRHG